MLVLDSEPDIIRWPRAVVYHAPTVEMLDKLGLLDELKVAGILKQDYQFRTVDGKILAAPSMSVLTLQDTPYPYNLHMPQHELARVILKNLLADFRRARCAGTRASPVVTQDADGVTLTVEANGAKRRIALRLAGRRRWRQQYGAPRARDCRSTAIRIPNGWFRPTSSTTSKARGYARANFIIDPVHWAVIVKVDRHGLWRVTYGEDARLPEDGVEARIAEHYHHLLPDRRPLSSWKRFLAVPRCMSAAPKASVSAASCWRAMPRMSAIRSAGLG